MNLFENAERLLRIAVDTDAWIANRRLNYSSIEGSFPIIGWNSDIHSKYSVRKMLFEICSPNT